MRTLRIQRRSACKRSPSWELREFNSSPTSESHQALWSQPLLLGVTPGQEVGLTCGSKTPFGARGKVYQLPAAILMRGHKPLQDLVAEALHSQSPRVCRWQGGSSGLGSGRLWFGGGSAAWMPRAPVSGSAGPCWAGKALAAPTGQLSSAPCVSPSNRLAGAEERERNGNDRAPC